MPDHLAVLGEYQVGKTIGQGAFSKVKIGVHKETGQKVAIKIIDKKQIALKAKKAKEAQQQRLERKRKQQERIRLDKEKQQQALKRANTMSKNRHSNNSEDSGDNKNSSEETKVQPPEIPSNNEREEIVKNHEKKQTGDDANATEEKPQEENESNNLLGKLQPEVQLLMRLDHPNIIKLYQVFETEDECYIIMEYAQGGELIDYIAARDRLSENEARKFFRQMISALDHCHTANVVHRDLKLENLLLNDKREILISDFGLGRTFRNDVDEYMSTFCGTPNYAAVELISGIPYIGVKSDIWAMGVVLYIMTTGRPPFSGENISALYSRIKSVDYKCPTYFSPGLINLLGKMLVKNPEDRATMETLRNDPWVNMDSPEKPLHVEPRVTGNKGNSARLINGITFDRKYVIYTIRRHEQQKKNIQRRASISSSKASKDLNTKRRSISFKNGQDPVLSQFASANARQQPKLTEELAEEEESPEKDDISALPALPSKVTSESTEECDDTTDYEPPATTRRTSRLSFRPQISSRGRSMSIQPDSAFFSSVQAQNTNQQTQAGSNLPHGQRRTSEQPSSSSSQQRGRQGSYASPTRTSSVLRRMSMVSPTALPVGLHHTQSQNTASPSGSQSQIANGAAQNAGASAVASTSATQQQQQQPLAQTVHHATRRQSIQLSSGKPIWEQIQNANNNTNISGSGKSSKRIHGRGRPEISSINTNSAQGSSENSPVSATVRGGVSTEVVSAVVPTAKDKQQLDATSGVDDLDPMNAMSPTRTSQDDDMPPVDPMLEADGPGSIPRPHKPTYNKFDILQKGGSDEDLSYADDDDLEFGQDEEPSVQEIQDWHEFHKPPKDIRTVRFSFNASTSSTESPVVMFQEIHRVLLDLAEKSSGKLTFQRIPDLYLVNCSLKGETPEENVELEIEICKIWMLKLHGVRIKRLSGNPFAFKSVYSQFVNSLAF